MDGERRRSYERYHLDPEFHARVEVAARVLLGNLTDWSCGGFQEAGATAITAMMLDAAEAAVETMKAG